jgi:hypothetical protein
MLLLDLEATDISVARIARDVNRHSACTRMIVLSTYTTRPMFDAGFHRHVGKVSGIADLLVVLLEDHASVS